MENSLLKLLTLLYAITIQHIECWLHFMQKQLSIFHSVSYTTMHCLYPM